MNYMYIQDIYDDLPEAKEYLDGLFPLHSSKYTFNELIDKVKDIVEAKGLVFDDFLRKHIYYFMDTACNYENEEFIDKYFSYIDSVYNYYKVTGKFERENQFADEHFYEFIDFNEGKKKKTKKSRPKPFNEFELDNLVFSYYTGSSVYAFGDYSYTGETVKYLNKDFIKLAIEKSLKESYGSIESLLYDFEEQEELPFVFEIFGVTIKNSKLVYEDLDKLKYASNVLEKIQLLGFGVMFKNTNISDENEGIYYLQYKLNGNEEYPLINALIKAHMEQNK